MKTLAILLIGICLFSCNQKNKSNSDLTQTGGKEGFQNFDWLVGKWKKLNDEAGKATFENWEKETPTRFMGHGFVIQKSDTIWQEKMVFSKNDSIWTLNVKTPGNSDLVEFKLTKHDSNSFVVENLMHDFPKKIKYWKDDEQLNALVEGDSMKIEFEFERVE